jgi:hypothetical protein
MTCFGPSMGNLQVDHYFVYKANHTISVANCMVCLVNKKVINLKMAHGRAETCHWEKLCKNILVIKTLNKLCLTAFYLYVLWCFRVSYGDMWGVTFVTVTSNLSTCKCAPALWIFGYRILPLQKFWISICYFRHKI